MYTTSQYKPEITHSHALIRAQV